MHLSICRLRECRRIYLASVVVVVLCDRLVVVSRTDPRLLRLKWALIRRHSAMGRRHLVPAGLMMCQCLPLDAVCQSVVPSTWWARLLESVTFSALPPGWHDLLQSVCVYLFLAMVWYGMVNVNLYSAIITRVSNALNMLVSGEKPGFQSLSKGIIVLLCAEVIRQGVPDYGAVHSKCSASNSG